MAEEEIPFALGHEASWKSTSFRLASQVDEFITAVEKAGAVVTKPERGLVSGRR